MSRPMGMPVAFGQCAGFFHDGGGSTGLLMLPAWGFEELTIRRGWAELAVQLSGAGYACLRFDWPGSADSLGDTRDLPSLAPWQDAVTDAATWLKGQGSIERIVVLGHGVGALMAAHAADRIGAEALVMMAPQRAGRAGMRELSVWGGLLASALNIPSQAQANDLDIGGFGLSAGLARDIGQSAPGALPPVASVPALLLMRPTRPGDAEWAEALDSAGFSVTRTEYGGHDRFVAHQTASMVPANDFTTILEWLGRMVPPGDGEQVARAPWPKGLALDGGVFEERPLLFGPEDRMAGILCTPKGQLARAVAVLVNSGFNSRIGWARSHVFLARKLAESGIASFRIDTHGLGDSENRPDPAAPLIYDDHQIRDVEAAIDAIAPLGLGPIITFGRCSGAYAAIQAAVRDSRVAGLVAVNAVRLILDPNETHEQRMHSGTTSIKASRSRALSPGLLGDILKGRMSLAHVIRRGTSMLVKSGTEMAGRLGGGQTHFARLKQEVNAQAARLNARGLRPILVFADNDAGLDELARYFGRQEPADYDHAEIRVVAETEHNMTAMHAREAMLSALVGAATHACRREAKAA
jgi:dienelactone hydrolase